MLILKILLILSAVICSFLLIAVILLQKAKGEGLGLAFGAQMGESLFGARASNVLVRITIWLGVIFLVSTVVLARIYARSSRGRPLMEKAPVEQGPMPVQPVAPPATPFTAPTPTLPETQPTPAAVPAAVPAEAAMPAAVEPAVPLAAPAPAAGE